MCADFVLKMHTAATEADIKKAIAAKLIEHCTETETQHVTYAGWRGGMQ